MIKRLKKESKKLEQMAAVVTSKKDDMEKTTDTGSMVKLRAYVDLLTERVTAIETFLGVKNGKA